MAKILTPEQAVRAICFDFEGCVEEAPSLLGWSFLRDDGTEHFRQRIVDHNLKSATHNVPHTNGKVRCSQSTLRTAVNRLVTLAEERDRLIVSWAEHDMKMIECYVDDDELVERARVRYMNALPTARQWLKRVHPKVQFPRTWSGKHNLFRYRNLMNISVPEKYDQDVAARGIRIAREVVARYGSYRRIPPEAAEARLAWKAVLGRNRLDCRTAREVVSRAAKEYADAGAPG